MSGRRPGDRMAALELLASREAIDGDFYQIASRALQLAFSTKWSAIGIINATGKDVDVISFTCDGKQQDLFQYSLSDSPCSVFYDGSGKDTAFYDSGLQDSFPLFGIFSEMGAEGYLAQPFQDTTGKPVGHCCIMDDKKVVLSDDDLAFFQLVIQRIGAEYRRREAELKAQNAVERMTQFLSTGTDWFWETDENHRMSWVDGKLFNVFQVPESAIIGKTRQELADQDDIAAEPQKWALHDKILAAHEPLREFTYSRTAPDGTRRIFRVTGSPHFHQDGRFAGYRGVASDITETEFLRNDIKRNKERLDFIVAGSNAALWDWNIETNERWYSNGWVSLLGLSTDELEKLNILDCIHPDDLAGHKSKLIAHLKGQSDYYEHQMRLQTADNSWIWLQCTGYSLRDKKTSRAMRFSGHAFDISQLKRTEAALTNSETRYALAFKASSEGIWEWNLETDNVFLSPALLQMLGYDAGLENATPAALEERIFAEDLENHRTAMRAYLRGKEPSYQGVFRVVTPDGKLRWVQSRGLAEFRPDGRATRMVGSFADITDMRQKELALNNALEQAEFANRAKIEFLANMSHELRTPLNSIIGFSETIRDRFFGAESKKYTEYAFYICDSARHLLELINDILDVSRIEAGEMPIMESEITVSDIMTSCARLIDRRVKERRVTFSQEIQPDLPRLKADERRLKQVFVNLLANAVKFTDPGGVILFSCEYNRETGMTFIVTDTGIGIPEDQLLHVMEMFRQVDGSFTRNYEGVGLGLPLSKKLVELQGGTLELRSREGVGTTAIVTLPPDRCLT